MNIIDKIENVREFATNSNGYLILLRTEDNILYCSKGRNSQLTIILESDLTLSNPSLNDNDIFWVNHTGENVKCYFGNILYSNIQEKSCIIKEIQKDYLYCSENGRGKKYDLCNNLIWELNEKFFIYHVSTYFLYVRNKNSLIAIDENTGLTRWQFILEEKYYHQGEEQQPTSNKIIERIIGIFENTLWIVTNLGHLLGISVETGLKVYHLTTPINIPAEWGNWQIFIEAQRSAIDYQKGVIFGIDNNIYWECDLNNPKETYLYYDISATCEKHQIKATLAGYQSVWYDDEIFFGQQEWAKDPSFVGIFNRKTREITWTSREISNDLFKGLSKIDFANNKLYVLDREGTLTILSKFYPVE